MDTIRFTPLMGKVCTSHILVTHHFLPVDPHNYVFLMSFVFPLFHAVCFQFLNLLVIIMFLLNFILFIFLLRTGTRGTYSLEVDCVIMVSMHLMCHQLLVLSAVFVCLHHIGMRALVILPLPSFAMYFIVMSFQSCPINMLMQFVMSVSKARVISFLFVSRVV